MPFASRRRFSAVRADGRVLVLGAPERFDLGALRSTARGEAEAGRRVVALASADALPADEDALPGVAAILGLCVLAERLRPDARQTVSFLRREGVELRVLSGDDPATAAAIATDAGRSGTGSPRGPRGRRCR